MVGAGRGGSESILARCSIVTVGEDNKIKILYDKYVKPTKKITDYRSQWSGVTPGHFEPGRCDVVSFEDCRNAVIDLISSSTDGRLVLIVGHALENDFEALKLKVCSSLIGEYDERERELCAAKRVGRLFLFTQVCFFFGNNLPLLPSLSQN